MSYRDTLHYVDVLIAVGFVPIYNKEDLVYEWYDPTLTHRWRCHKSVLNIPQEVIDYYYEFVDNKGDLL